MQCIKCSAPTRVIDSRSSDDGTKRRRRECRLCYFRISTEEVLISEDGHRATPVTARAKPEPKPRSKKKPDPKVTAKRAPSGRDRARSRRQVEDMLDERYEDEDISQYVNLPDSGSRFF